MNRTPATASPVVPALESVLCTEELNSRPSRPPDYEKESRALVSLAQALADSPLTILQTLADTILKVFQCGSAGVSLVTADGTRFHWPAIAGVWNPHIGGGTPRDFGPCGDVLDRNCPLLFRHFERRYTYFLPVTPPIAECLLVPFYVAGQAVGTIWAITHDDRPGARKFDNEDLRMLVSLGTFASAAYQAVEQLRVLGQRDHERQEAAQALRDMNEALLVSSVKQHELAEQAKNAETAMRKSETRYRRLFESATDGILILDAHTGRITDANAGMGGLMETESHELLGKELWEIGRVSDKSASEAAVRELQAKGCIRYENLPLESIRGRLVEVEVVANVYREDDHSVVQCHIRDITERRRLERQTQEQAAALADQDRRKDEFLAMLSHELRNPLAPIHNALILIRLGQQEPRPEVRQAYDIIDRQVENLVRLVDDLLDLGRITSGKIQLQKERIDLAAVIARAIEGARPLIDARRHTLEVNLPEAPVPVEADPVRLAQVLWNLLNNAAKYTPDGGRITLEVERGNGAVVRIRDTGIGIAPEMLPKVFDLFTQMDRSLDRAEGGLGIGLTLVRRLTEMHGGTVAATSEGQGQGCEFVVHLPALPDEASPAGPTLPALAERHVAPASGRRILVVDDNRDSAESMAMLLRLFGNDVRTVQDGRLALEVAAAYHPSVVLLDICLPGLDGLEVCRRLRARNDESQPLIVALTGYGMEEDRRRCQEAGFDRHMVKPVDIETLQEMLSRPEIAGYRPKSEREGLAP
ncbi:MAG: ATP-binding protein [Isosphaeraceae bacterium]